MTDTLATTVADAVADSDALIRSAAGRGYRLSSGPRVATRRDAIYARQRIRRSSPSRLAGAAVPEHAVWPPSERASPRLPRLGPLVIVALLLAGCTAATDQSASPTSAVTAPSATPTSDVPELEGVEVFDLDAQDGGAALVHGDVVLVAAPLATIANGQVDMSTELLTVDPATGKVTSRVEPEAPVGVFMTPDGGSIWATDFEGASVNQLNPDTGAMLKSLTTGNGPEGVAVAGGSLWVANHRDGSVSRFDRETGQALATIAVGPAGRSGPQAIIADERYVYVGVPNINSVVRIDITTNSVSDTIKIPSQAIPCGAMAIDGDAVWVTSCMELYTAARVDFATGSATVTADLGGYSGIGVLSDDVMWLTVAGHEDARLVALDDRARVIAQYGLPGGGIDGAAGNGALWIPAPEGRLVKVPLTSLPEM